MSKIPFQNLKIPFHGTEKSMATADHIAGECRLFVALAGGERGWADTRGSWLARAARRLGISPGRATSLFYGKARNISAVEYLTLKERADSLRCQAERAADGLAETNDRARALGITSLPAGVEPPAAAGRLLD